MGEELDFTAEKFEQHLTCRLVRGVSKQDFLERLHKGRPIAFIATTKYEILIGEVFHRDIILMEGIDLNERLIAGDIEFKDGRFQIPYFSTNLSKITSTDAKKESLMRVIRDKIISFVGTLK